MLLSMFGFRYSAVLIFSFIFVYTRAHTAFKSLDVGRFMTLRLLFVLILYYIRYKTIW